jgi:hypothetical protein
VLPHAAASAEPDAAFGSCPDAFPVADLTDGMPVTGLTVEKGTAAEPFTGAVVGVVDDGIATGVDMIVIETDSPAIERAGGIWAGMSGSPVYTEDGELIGAVAYGFSWAPSPIAGVTPAADMYKVLQRQGTPGFEPKSEVELPADIRDKLVKSSAATRAQATAGMRRLPLPMSVSGLGDHRLGAFSQRLQAHGLDADTYRLGTAASGGSSSPEDIFPGSNFAAALS